MTSGSAGVELLKRTLPKGQTHFRQPLIKRTSCISVFTAGSCGRDRTPCRMRTWSNGIARRPTRPGPGKRSGRGRGLDRRLCPRLSRVLPGHGPRPRTSQSHAFPPGNQGRSRQSPPLANGDVRHLDQLKRTRSRELHGCKFQVHDGLVFPFIEYPYNPMMDLLEAMECPATGEKVAPAVKLGTKAKRNSVVGKSATKRVQERLFLGDAPEEQAFLYPFGGRLGLGSLSHQWPGIPWPLGMPSSGCTGTR